MAIPYIFAIHLMQRADTFGFSGRLVTLGRYNLWFTNADFLKMAESSGFKPRYTPGEEEDLAPSGMSSRLFFRALGFSELIEIEYFDEAPGLYIFDLNSQETPEDLIDTADAVFDFGTSEHVFHTPRLLAHIGRMLRSGGIVAHHTPMNNQVNHGFYQFSPTLYADYYGVNGYETLDFAANLAADYDAPDQQFVPLDAKQAVEVIYKTSEMLAMNTFFARKTDRSTINVFPQQNFYQKPNS